jgi:hypothetical protein
MTGLGGYLLLTAEVDFAMMFNLLRPNTAHGSRL